MLHVRTLYTHVSGPKCFMQHSIYQYCTGWWFQTFVIFHNIWDVILPIDELMFFKMVLAPPTSVHMLIVDASSLVEHVNCHQQPTLVLLGSIGWLQSHPRYPRYPSQMLVIWVATSLKKRSTQLILANSRQSYSYIISTNLNILNYCFTYNINQ